MADEFPMTPADYFRQQQEQADQAVKRAALIASQPLEKTQDEYAKSAQLAKSMAMPTAVIDPNYKTFAQKMAEKRTEMILSGAPVLTDWITKDDNYKVASDDLDGLSWFEGFGKGVWNTTRRAGQRLGTMYDQAMLEQTAGRARDRNLTFGEILDSEREVIEGKSGAEYKMTAGPTDLFGAFARYADARYADLIGTDDEAAARDYAARLDEGRKALAAIPKSQIATTFEKEAMVDGAGFGDTLANFGKAIARNPVGALSWALETAGESAPSLVAAAATTAATRNPTAGVAVLGAGSYATERYTSPADFLAEKGLDLSKQEDVTRLLADPKLMKEAQDRGVIRGAIIGALDAASGGIAGKALAGNPLVEALAQGTAQAVMGSAGELGARLAAGQEIDWNEVVAEGIAELATTPIEMGVAGRRFMRDRDAAKRAEGNAVQAEELSASAQASKLRARLPDGFRGYLDQALADGPVENVYVPAEDFVQYFQGQGVDPWELTDDLDGVSRDDLDAAIAGGGDLKIPTATYAAKIAGSEADPFFMENMRFSPDDMTAREAAEFNARAQDVMDEAWAEAERVRQEDEALRGVEETIFVEMQSRLRQAGRSTDVANTEALLFPAFYRVMAERSGLTTEEFLARYPLPQVEGARPEGMQTKDVSAFNRMLAEARNRREVKTDRGQSLLEFISERGGINDPGGELRSRDAQVVKRGRGKKSLRLARDTAAGSDVGISYSVDDVARAAIEAGFLADNPDAMEYRQAIESGGQAPDLTRALWDAIDEELRGNSQYATEPDYQAEGREADLDELEVYLNSVGVSLSDGDDAILAAVRQDEQGRRYAQGEPRLLFHNTGNTPRGSIQFPVAGVGNGETIIRLSERADLSTFLHETGHYFLTVLQDMAATDPAVAGEFATIKGWWRENAGDVAKDARKAFPDLTITAAHIEAAIDTGTSGDAAIDQAIDVGMQEQWARAFETYAMEGKAPSAELRGAFERFRAWLLSIYRKLSSLNVNVSDDLRRVFDRMIATDEEIAQATADAGGSAPLFATAEQMGLTDEEFARFQKLRGQAEDEAKARLLAETMEPIRREREKWFKEERAQVRETVEREVNAYRQYRAIEWMGNRRWLGDDQPEAMPDMRLSKAVLIERYGEGILKTLPRGKQTVYTVDGGFDPDEAAGWFGFDSGDEMLQAMERAQPRKEAIEAETDKRMREEHGDVLNDGRAEEEALAAVHNDKRGEWLAAELKAVVDVAGAGNSMTAKQARTVARQTMARMKVRDAMAAGRFLAAERKAGLEAARLGAILAREGVWMGNARRRIATKARAALREDGTVDAVAGQVERANASTENYNETVEKLIEAKRRQLLNHALYSEARKVTEEVAKAERFVAKLNKASKREKIAGAGRRENAQIDYLGAIDEILDRYDFRRMSGRAEDRRGSLLAFVEAMKAAGREREIAIPENVLADAVRTPYKTLPVEELRGVIDSLKNLEHVALRWNDLIDAQNRREFEASVGDIVGEFEANVDRRPPGRVGTTGEALRNAGRQFIDLVLSSTTILREIDGFRDFGGAYRNIKAPIDEAMNRLTIRKRRAAGDLETLYDVYSKGERRAMAVRKFIPALDYSLSKWEMIAVALNTGNEGNYQRLTDPRVKGSLTEDQVQAVLANLDARDAKFVQSVWDYLETFRPDIAARERRATGVEPEWVEAKPVTIAGRELKGGYYPLRYDPRLSSLARDDAENEIASALQAGRFGKAQTKNGHLQSRAQSSGRDVQLDMSVLHRHVNQVIYDLELSEPVANSWRVLQAAPVRDQFIQTGRMADFEALERWLLDVGQGQIASGDWVGSAARTLKSNFTASKLAFNLATVAMQVTGLTQTMVVVGKRDFLRGLQASFRPGIREEIAAKSAFMSERQTTFNKDITDFYDDPKIGPAASRWGDFKREIMGPASFWLMTKVQWHTVDVPTWLAGYEKGLRKYGNDEARAVAYADDIVKRAQSSGLFSDRSAIERGSVTRNTRQNDVIRLFTTLGSYMFAKFNVAYERSAVAAQAFRAEGVSVAAAREALSWTIDMAFLFTLEAVVIGAIKGGLPDDDDEEGKDGWAKFLAKQTAFSVMGTVPFIRDGASALQGFDGGGAYGSAISTMVKAGKGGWNVITAPLTEGGEIRRTDVKNIINGTGLATGLPATQINRSVDAAWRQTEGEDVSPAEYLLGKSHK